MKKTTKNAFRTFLLAVTGMITGASAFAQEVVSTYDIKTTKHARYWIDVPMPAVIFGLAFVLIAYLIYHFVQNGKLKDDMS